MIKVDGFLGWLVIDKQVCMIVMLYFQGILFPVRCDLCDGESSIVL